MISKNLCLKHNSKLQRNPKSEISPNSLKDNFVVNLREKRGGEHFFKHRGLR